MQRHTNDPIHPPRLQSPASKARVSVSYVSTLERGERTPPLETLNAVAKALAIYPVDLPRERATRRSRSGRG